MLRGWELFDKVSDQMDDSELLMALAKAMGDDELYDCLEYIVRCYDLEGVDDD